MCIELDHDDIIHMHNEEHRRARKEHRCCECHRTILKGERYLYEFGTQSGDAMQFKTCAHCELAREWIVINCRYWLYGGTQEDLQEHFSEARSYATKDRWWLARALVGMKRRWDQGRMRLPRPPTLLVGT